MARRASKTVAMSAGFFLIAAGASGCAEGTTTGTTRSGEW